MEKPIIGFSKKEKIGIGALLFFIVTAPIFFTQFSTGISFLDTGAIGDTIGGITAPFVNLLAAYLVYKSFTAQINTNTQQREDHDEQMTVLLNEQSINYLLNLYENMEKDYVLNLEGGDNGYGWATQLANGFHKLDKSKEMKENPEFDYTSDTDEFGSDIFVFHGKIAISTSVYKVNYIYHNFAMLTDALFNAVSISKDRNLQYIARYITAKISSLFNSNNYNYILSLDIQSYVDDKLIDKELGDELRISKDAATQIQSRLIDIMKITEYENEKKPPKH